MDHVDPKEYIFDFFTNMVKNMKDYELIALKRACLKEIKARDDESFSYDSLNLPAVISHGVELSPLNTKEKKLVDKKFKFEAMKEYCNRTGCSLIEAKPVIDQYATYLVQLFG